MLSAWPKSLFNDIVLVFRPQGLKVIDSMILPQICAD